MVVLSRCLLTVIFVTSTATAAHAGLGNQGIDFQGIDFQGIDFQGIDFQGIDFQGIDFQGTFLEGLDDGGAVLDGLAYEHAELDGSALIVTFLDPATGQLERRHPLVHFKRIGGLWAGPFPGGLAGMRWTREVCDDTSCVLVTFHLVAVQVDTSTNTMTDYSSNDDVFLYAIKYRVSGDPTFYDACKPDLDGYTYGSFVAGQWGDDGAYLQAGVTFSCSSGVILKCVRQWGYKPWLTLTSALHGDADLAPLHRACVRAARADYCGDGTSNTQDGTLIDMFDTYGLNVPASPIEVSAAIAGAGLDIDKLELEAYFAPIGAITVDHERWPETTVLVELLHDWVAVDSCLFQEFSATDFDDAVANGNPLIAVRSNEQDLITGAIPPE